MGLQISQLVPKKEISLDRLNGKVIAIDAFNMLYQFLTTIRQLDGTPLMDSRGNVTSHLVGLFYRTTNLMSKGIKPIFVFDGKKPEFKKKEVERRLEVKEKALEKFKESKEEHDIKGMQKYAKMATFLTSEMVEQAKELISALGLPVVQAPSEGEAQAAYIVKKKQAYAAASQDYDTLLFGCPIVVRNLAITGKRKVPGKDIYVEVSPEIVKLNEVLETLGIDHDQFIVFAMLVGTDFNPGGIKKIGPKKALELVKKYGKDFEKIFEEVLWQDHYPDLDWKDIFEFIKSAPVTDEYEIKFREIDRESVKKILVDQFEFSEERVENAIEKASRGVNVKQRGLMEFFKK